jgi:polyphenol oxidase
MPPKNSATRGPETQSRKKMTDATRPRADGICSHHLRRRTQTKIEIVHAPPLLAFKWLYHAFSTRIGGQSVAYNQSQTGELNLGFTAFDEKANVVANRERFLEAVTGNPKFPIVTLYQIHSGMVVRVDTPRRATDSGLAKADGMMTSEPGLLLAIQTADCIPVLVADRKRRAVAAFHAGWRGTLKRIVERGVGQMRIQFGSRPEDLVAAIGPGIGQCCYAVGEEVRDEFESQFSYAAELFRELGSLKETDPLSFLTGRPPGHGSLVLHLDLVEANRRQLLDAGLNTNAISAVQECTSCNTSRYFSYRAEGGFTGRMLSVIGICPV